MAGVLAVVGLFATIGVAMAYDGENDGENQHQAPSGEQQVAKDVLPVAKQDMAQRLGVNPGDIEIVKIEDAMWQDTSLGVPKSGEMYAQVVTPGFVITLNAGDFTYVYNTDASSSVVLAEIQQ